MHLHLLQLLFYFLSSVYLFGIHHLLAPTYYQFLPLEHSGGQLMHSNHQLFDNFVLKLILSAKCQRPYAVTMSVCYG